MTDMTGLVGPAEVLHGDGGELIALGQGFVLAKVGEAGWDRIGAVFAQDPDAANDLNLFLSLLLKGAGVRAGGTGRFVYLEFDDVKQAAMVGEGSVVVDTYTTDLDGTQARIPRADWAANRALRQIGVRTEDATDECAALGLPR